jgi:signal transduction histidine kinase
MSLFSLSCFFVIIATSLIGCLIFLKAKERDVANTYGALCMAAAIWGVGGAIFSTTSSKEVAYIGWQVAHFGMIFTPPLFFHFVCRLTKTQRRFLIILSHGLGFAYLYFVLFSKVLFLGELEFIFNQFYWLAWNKQKSIIYLIYYITFYHVLLSYAFLLLLKFYNKSQGLTRNKVKYIIIASLIGWLGPHGMFLLVFGIKLYPFSNFCIAIYPLIIAYTILKYRVMDISVAITRTGIFIATYSLVLGIPFALAFGYRSQMVGMLGSGWWIFPMVLLTILATAGPFIYLYLNKKAEDRLLREQRNYQNVLRGASGGMIRIKNLKQLLNIIVHIVTKIVRIRHASIYLLNKESGKFVLQASRGTGQFLKDRHSSIDSDSPLLLQLISSEKPIIVEEIAMMLRGDQNNYALARLFDQLHVLGASLIVPSFIEDRLIGILILGEKVSKKVYSEDDLAVFSVLANQAALAIENAQFYEEIKQTHEQLFQAEKMATIGTMADGLSHQINNRFHALSLIAGDSLDMLETFDSSACNDGTKQVLGDLRGALKRIETNVLQGGEVVKGLLKYSRPGDTGHEAVDFRDVVSGAIDMLQYKIKLKEIDLIQDIPQDTPKIYANLIQLQEVFFNLIDNAYDATKERQATLKEEGYRGKIQIQVRPSDSVLGVVVSDNGMGIKDLDKKKLFTPFFTTKATAKKGTGLGLYVIEKIIASHKGKISIDSTYLSGTQFNITLPIFKTSEK